MTIPHEPWLVALSIAIAIQGSFVGLSLARELDSAEGFRRRLALAGSALTLATGAWSMHFVGMSAVPLAGPTSYAPSYVAASIVVSIAASAFALWAIDRRPTRPRLFLGAIALGLAISGMHYTAMAGMRLDPLCFDVTRFVAADSALSRNALALLTTMISFGVSAAFLLSLVPEGKARLRQAPAFGATIGGDHSLSSPAAEATPVTQI